MSKEHFYEYGICKVGYLYLDILQRESNFFAFYVPGHCCACAFAAFTCVYDSIMVYASLRANNATYTHTHKAVTGCVESKTYSLVEGNRSIESNKIPQLFHDQIK